MYNAIRFRCPEDLHEAIKRKANKAQVPMGQYLVRLLELDLRPAKGSRSPAPRARK